MKLLILASYLSYVVAKNQPPAWPNHYSVEGVLTIPFAEIMEPFQAYIDFDDGNSRIDYYNGMDKTYQLSNLGSYGSMLKVKTYNFWRTYSMMLKNFTNVISRKFVN